MRWAFVSTKAHPFPSGFGVFRRLRDELRRDDVVSFCPPDTPAFREAWLRGYLGSGLCEGGYEPLLKPVAAIEGDRVSRTERGYKDQRALDRELEKPWPRRLRPNPPKPWGQRCHRGQRRGLGDLVL